MSPFLGHPRIVTDAEQGCYCPVFHQSIELVGRRWTGVILLALFADVHRFGELKASIPGLSDRLLTERLKELEAAGIVLRTPGTHEVNYDLTVKGLALKPTLDALVSWVGDWAEQGESQPQSI